MSQQHIKPEERRGKPVLIITFHSEKPVRQLLEISKDSIKQGRYDRGGTLEGYLPLVRRKTKIEREDDERYYKSLKTANEKNTTIFVARMIDRKENVKTFVENVKKSNEDEKARIFADEVYLASLDSGRQFISGQYVAKKLNLKNHYLTHIDDQQEAKRRWAKDLERAINQWQVYVMKEARRYLRETVSNKEEAKGMKTELKKIFKTLPKEEKDMMKLIK